MRIFLVILSLFVILFACGTHFGLRQDFEESFRDYNEMLRWHDYAKATLFASQSIREEFEMRAREAKDVMVVDYRILNTEFNAEKAEAKVEVEIDYYIFPSNRVQTVADIQKWAYIEDNGKKEWRLMTLFPEFKKNRQR